MGYKKKNKTYKLIWDEGEFMGLEVRCKGLPLGRFLSLATLLDMDAGALTPADVEKMDELFKLLGSVLVDWNYEDADDVPIPCNTETLYDEEYSFAVALATMYAKAISTVPVSLGKESTSGEQSQELGIPMTVNT